MNRQQKNYATAKAVYQEAKEAADNYEIAFIAREGIKNDDGTIPKFLYMMEVESEAYFDECSAKLDNDPKYIKLFDAERRARKLLSAAEEDLIDYALSLPMPEEAREALDRGRNNYKIRQKLIDLTFKLDTRTVKA